MESDALGVTSSLQHATRGRALVDLILGDVRRLGRTFVFLLSGHVYYRRNTLGHLARLLPCMGDEFV